jgi:hypothetical protein
VSIHKKVITLFNKDERDDDLAAINQHVNVDSTNTLTMRKADKTRFSKPVGGATMAAEGTRQQGELQAVNEKCESE